MLPLMLSVCGNGVVVCRDGQMLCRGSGDVEVVETQSTVVFVAGCWAVDSEKSLFVLEDGRLRRMFRLRRGIFCLLEHASGTYVADRFGDVYRIRDTGCEYVLGMLSYPTAMAIYNESILVGDKYGRIRISSLDGRIAGYLYGEPVVSLVCIGGFLVVVSSGQAVLYEGSSRLDSFDFPSDVHAVKGVERGNELVVLCTDSYLILRVQGGIELVSHVQEAAVDGVCVGDRFYREDGDHRVMDGQELFI